MTKAFIQLQDGLLPLGVTKEDIENSLGYVPSDINEVNNLSKIVSTQSSKIENNTTNIDSIKRNIDYISEMINDEGSDFTIRDEYGNVGLKLDRNGLFVNDVFANAKNNTDGIHKLSNKANLDYVEKEIGDLKSTISSNTKKINLNSESISSITDIVSGDGNEFIIKDEDGNIGLKLNNDGLYVNDVTAGIDKLSNKADKDYVDLVKSSAIFFESITYNNIVKLRNNSQLIPGRQYRIIDYVTTTTQENTQSAGHQFDIIVTANSNNTLNEVAMACLHDGDTYFSEAGAKLEAWKIWYCIDNDANRFAWADNENGKGVIYRMIDEWGNDCPYDFKNIMFKRGLYVDGGGATIYDDFDFKSYCYTFSWEETQNEIIDASIAGNNGNLLNGEGQISGVYGNVIGVQHYNYENGQSYTIAQQYLNDIVFFSTFGYGGGAFYGCLFNTFGDECCFNTFGNNCNENNFGDVCILNTFGNDCYLNTFGDYCAVNTFGNNCIENAFDATCLINTFGSNCFLNTFCFGCCGNILGNECSENTFGIDCQGNTFGSNCCENTFGNTFHNNNFGNECYGNTFGNTFHNNNFGDVCHSNTFGDVCQNNTFDNSCYSNTFGNGCYNNTFGNNCYSNTFGNNCYSNTFGYNCNSNTFGNNCNKNTFDTNCYDNTFGTWCYTNTFGTSCCNNAFGNGCSINAFGNGCSNNAFGADCKKNTFDNGCQNNTLGNMCTNNKFGKYCSDNTFGNLCEGNTFGKTGMIKSYYRHIVFEDYNSYIALICTEETSSEKYYQNVRIGFGVNNSTTVKEIEDGNVNQTYVTLYKPENSHIITV